MKWRKSPCIDVFEFTGANGLCLGCGRNRQECQKWKKMKPYEMNILQKEIQKRLSQMMSKQIE